MNRDEHGEGARGVSDETTGASGVTGGSRGSDPGGGTRRWVVPLVLVLLAALPIAGVTAALVGSGDADADADDGVEVASDDGDDRVAQERAERDQALADEAATICGDLDADGGVREQERYEALLRERDDAQRLRRAVRNECGDTLTDINTAARTESGAVADGLPQEATDMIARSGFRLYFDDARDDFATALEISSEIESVDVMAYDPDSEIVRVVVSSVYSTEDRLRSVAWDVARAMTVAVFDHSEGLWGSLDFEVTWLPDFELDVEGLTYRCSGETMGRIADRGLSRSEWESACS